MKNNFLSQRAQNFKGSGIRKIFNMAATLKDPINFSIGQPDFPPIDAVKQKTIEAIENNLSGYTPSSGILPLREKIVQKFSTENNIKTTVNQVLVTPGASAGVFLALSTIIDQGDEVIIPDPCFVEYPELVTFLNGQPVLLDTYPEFQIDPEKLESLVTNKTKAIVINTPNNPTGAVYPEATLRQLAKIAEKHNLIIISDEIYEYFIYDQVPHFSIGSIYPNTITINGLSKSGGMPGWRLCWATGPEEILDKMQELFQYTYVCAPSIVQYGAVEAIGNHIQSKVEEYKKRRDYVYTELSKKFEVTRPQGAFYIMPKVGNGQKFTEWAIENNVLVIPGGAFSQKDTHIRISYATNQEKIKQGIEMLLKFKE